MNLKCFITAFATFFSISVAQGASFLSNQKLGQGTSFVFSPESFFSKKKLSDNLFEDFQASSSCLDEIQREAAVELLPVSYSNKRKGHRSKYPRSRPSLFKRGPMSF
ncbi:hypothetical protein [Bartonella florencae]|uniref:hypothetical protein n=1 Tax=Bartonella florencae TaxID=928210 RepID=UPI0002EFE2F3|nr:hypothetical protein [Bartonella florencae]